MLGNLDKYQIILASNSPRRKELMSGLGVDYVVRTLPDVDESYPADLAGAAIPEYISRKKALAQAAEAKQAFTILQREHEPDADRWLQEVEQLLYALTHEPPTAPAAYNIESLQLD